MFYSLISVIAVNFFWLFTYAPTTKEDKFLIYLAFREALCKGFFTHAKLYSIVIVVGPITAVVINKVVVGVVGIVGARVEYQRIKMKRLICVIYK